MCCPKLAFNEGQLFSSLYGSISVHCGSDWLPTSMLRVDPICDSSVGGNHLFALHYQENVIDVRETPRPPII
ncbi:hypothetical protein EJD97_013400 [Solanum chilense]|uniref:At2g24240-like C-terminal beta-propeller domain-containing protein n=1 Tax=Solanum chilense TaxID=4083 RepID=A0A6N2BDI0_SOLCI|nr:hypothetical protein EJD97_013400 [Solanum chilense]